MRKGTQLLLIYLQTKTPFLPLTLPMELTAENKLKKLIVVGDRVLIKPLKESDKTTSGILLPPGVREKEKIQTGFIVKVGPGYPIPVPMDEDDAWKQEEDQMKYVPNYFK